MAAARELVWPENRDAWRVFQRIASRVVMETEVGVEVFRRLTETLDADDLQELLERLNVIHEIVVPKKRDA